MMKRYLPVLLICFVTSAAFSQDRLPSTVLNYSGFADCGTIIVDLDNGSVNGLNPVSSPEEIKSKLPCFTGISPEQSPENCNGGVFYKNRDVYFYTRLDCINIRSKFEGSFRYNRREIRLIGITLAELTSTFGKESDFYKLDATNKHKYPIFSTGYGLIVFHLIDDHVVELNICNQKRSDLKICD